PWPAAGATRPQRLAAAATSASQARRCMLFLPVLGSPGSWVRPLRERLAYSRARATIEPWPSLRPKAMSGQWLQPRRLGLHAPATHGCRFDVAEDQVFHAKADQDHGEQPGEHGGYVEHVLVFVDVPAEPTFARGDAEHQLGGDQRAPGKG